MLSLHYLSTLNCSLEANTRKEKKMRGENSGEGEGGNVEGGWVNGKAILGGGVGDGSGGRKGK